MSNPDELYDKLSHLNERIRRLQRALRTSNNVYGRPADIRAEVDRLSTRRRMVVAQLSRITD